MNSERMRQFLEFVVERSLDGETGRLKESVIGVEVFGRAPDYDPKLEPIVRIEARRLREKLQEYYERQGNQDPVVIQLPKGHYVPTFEMRPVPVAPAVLEMPSPLDRPANVPPRRIASRTRWLLWSGLVVAASVAALLIIGRPKPSPPNPAVVPLTSLPGNAFRPSISPDGKRVAFVWDGGSDNFDIYVKLINTGDPFRLTTNPEAETDPAWSPDGSRIAFRRILPDHDEIVLAPALGGAERRIPIRTTRPSNPVDQPLRCYGPSWSPDGRQIAMVDSNGDEPAGIYLVNLESGDRRRLTTPARRDEWDSDPSFSPQGDQLAFVRWRAGAAGSSDLFVQSIKGGEPRRLTFDRRQISGLTWAPDGRRIIFASDRNQELRLWEVAVSGAAPTLVAGAGRGTRHPSLSPDGKRLAFSELVFSNRIWRVPLAGPNRAPEPFMSSSRRDNSPAYSPDGKRVAFISDRAGPAEIWICDANGARAAPIASLRGFVPGTPRWSPNSADLVFDSKHEGFAAIYTVSADGGRVRRLTPESSNSMMPSWSADGRFVYFASDRTGSWQVWKRPIGEGAPVQVTKKGGREAHESPDGKFVYYAAGPIGLWKAPVDGGDEAPISEFANVTHRRHWRVTVRGIYYLSTSQAPWTISFFDFATKQSKPVFTTSEKPVIGTSGLTISPDGQWLLLAQVQREGSDLMLLENFQ